MELEGFELIVLATRACSWVIMAGCFLGGLGLLIAPKAMAKLSKALDRSVSTDRLYKKLEKVIGIDNWILRHRVVVGLVALVVSIVLFFLLV